MPPTPSIASDEIAELPLSFAQERLWYIDRLVPGSPAYNIPVALELTGRLDRAAWARAVAGLRRRHEALRTTFAETADGVVQRIAPPASAAEPIPEIDLSGLADGPRRRETERRIGEELRRPFDLARGPLLRAAVVAAAPRQATALLVVHHIVADGWSLALLLEELATLYGGTIAGAAGAPPLPELALQYGDFAVWQREWLTPEILAEPLAHFRAALDGAPPVLALPADRPRPPVQSFRGRRRSTRLPAELVARLGRLGRARGATLFMTLLAGFAALLHRLSGAAALPIGLPVAGRSRTELEGIVGLLVNTVVVCPRIAPGEPFDGLLAQVREIGARRLCARAPAVRASGRGAARRLVALPQPDLPGPLRLSRRGHGDAEPSRPRGPHPRLRSRGGARRPLARRRTGGGRRSHRRARAGDRPLRPGDRRAPPRRVARAARRRRRVAAEPDRRPAAPHRRGAAPADPRVERHRGRLPAPGDARRALRPPGGAGAGGDGPGRPGGGRRGLLWRARPPRRRAGAAPHGARRRAGVARRAPPRPLGRPGRRHPRHREGGGRLRAARPRPPGGAARLPAGRLARRSARHPSRPGGTARGDRHPDPRPRRRPRCRRPGGGPGAAPARLPRVRRPPPTTSPTSCTPRARPGGPRGSPSPTAT